MSIFNTAKMIGRVPPESWNESAWKYYPGNDTKKSMMSGLILVRRNKKKDEQYAQEDKIPFVCWGHNADYLDKYCKRGDTIIMNGSMEFEENREKEDGSIQYGRLRLIANEVTNITTRKRDDANEGGAPATEQAPKASSNPLTNRRRSII